jgi:PIN domain nuclease of toxin-antitoxin system
MYWYIEGDPKLSGNAQAVIQDTANDVFVGPASYWEIAIKVSIGKWTLNRPYDEFIDLGLHRYGFGLLPIQPEHAARVASLPFLPGHRDPFDRMLVAQALVENLELVSSDAQLDGYGVRRIW